MTSKKSEPYILTNPQKKPDDIYYDIYDYINSIDLNIYDIDEQLKDIYIKCLKVILLYYLFMSYTNYYKFFKYTNIIMINKYKYNKKDLLFGINKLFECLNSNDDCEEEIELKNILLEKYICFLPCGHYFHHSNLYKIAEKKFYNGDDSFDCPTCSKSFDFTENDILYINLHNLKEFKLLSKKLFTITGGKKIKRKNK